MKTIVQTQELKFLALTLALVVILGMGSLFNMARAPDAVMAKTQNAAQRLPASLPLALPANKLVSALSQTETLDWSCGDAAKNVEVSTNRLRVKGRGCGKETLSIINETNGLNATVFESEKGYSTEYMDLSMGKNEILFHWLNKKGEPQKTQLTVIRN